MNKIAMPTPLDNFQVYIGDKPIATATSCKFEASCDPAEGHDWTSIQPIECSFSVEQIPALLEFRLRYGDFLDFHDNVRKQLWYLFH